MRATELRKELHCYIEQTDDPNHLVAKKLQSEAGTIYGWALVCELDGEVSVE